MSGGIAYVLDEMGDFARRCNGEMVDLEALAADDDVALVRSLVSRHADYTGSAKAAKVLADWPRMLPKFVKVMPRDYRRVLQAQARAAAEGREPLWQELVGV
jgi:glutamate synthase (ferredoxin)